MDDKNLYIVDCIGTYRMRYAVKCKSEEEAIDCVTQEDVDLIELSQKWLGQTIFDVRECDEVEFLEIFDNDNGYFDNLSVEQKLIHINVC